MADSYTWATTNSGDWSNASNWFDVTTGTPAIAAPGPADTAEIDNAGTGTITVTGPADVSGLSVSGNVTLAGNFSTGTGVLGVPPFNPSFLGPTFTSTITLAGTFVASSLAIGDLHLVPGFASFPVADYGLIEVDQGAMLSAGSVTLNSGDLQVNGGAVSISNDLTLGVDLFPQPSGLVADVTSGSLTVTNHGSVQLGGLAITDGSVSLDATSTLEIGNAGTATAGTITVDPGAVLTEGDGLSHVAKVVHDAETVDISAPVLNNGVIDSDQNISDVINNGTINADNDALSFISGNGVVNLGHEGTIGSGDSGTFDIAFGDTIVLALGTGVPIDVTDTPLIADFATSNALETIVLQGISADTATYTATGLGIGTLTLDRGLTQVASLTMLGTYDSDSFVVVPQSGNSILTLNTVAPPASFTWATSGSGAWSNAANWFDVTTGLPASAPPGLLDTAEIDNPNPGTITVTGPANIASLSVNGDVTLAGGFAIGSMMLGVPPGGTGSPQPGVTTQTIALAGDFAASTVTIGS
ncbi:MAG: hypothetical protein QOF70_1154, partial [Acetobacteraceae bacterium]|nr:hypothetical protein [Acetobacteraceae bacterium]